MNTAKRCTGCRVEKPISDFHNKKNRKTGKVGKTARCKSCIYEQTKEWRRKNADEYRRKQRTYRQKWRSENPERNKKHRDDEYWRNRDHHLERMRKWRRDNPETFKACTKRWRTKNYERHLEGQREWRKRNAHHLYLYGRYRYHNFVKLDPRHKARERLRYPINVYMAAITGKGPDPRSSPLPYSPEHLREKLESQFAAGMSWKNYGQWTIDHKVPLARFVDNGEYRPEVANALCNIQPLWRPDNARKRDKTAFQSATKGTLIFI